MEEEKRETYFDILNVSPSASPGEIEFAYSKQKEYHQGDPQRLAEIQEAYDTLINAVKRNKYIRRMTEAGQLGGPKSAQKKPSGYVAPAAPAKKQGVHHRTEIMFLDEKPSQPDGEEPLTIPRRPGRTQTQVSFVPQTPEPPPVVKPEPAAKRGVTDELKPSSPPSNPVRTPTDPGRNPGRVSPPAANAEPVQNQESTSSPAAYQQPVQKAPPQELKPGYDINETQLRAAPEDMVMQPAKQAELIFHVELIYQGRKSVFLLARGENVIGRPTETGTPPDIPLPDEKRFISRRHATIIVDHDHCILRDEGSANGTFLNNEKLQKYETRRLKVGDAIIIEGRSLTLNAG